ncbi:oligosaccharide flippase family protein [Mucilaginibacter sp. SP1R1]|uniref:oligosaccharide flippase family protein n=1 Tax=Mucilaginibacter sp. SP1R1 TaxID=2723091 RepID=UPI001607C94B|nr:oligosaccharide flippase family protein [Mucilaginibacter sp. SP1R1]MBB6152606.1 O-antigen/teichoic acid export membrane protein [Mucilaginibacter sp. SP1R1]
MSNTSAGLLKNTIIYSIGNLGSKLLSFLLVPLYSFYLSKSDLGYYDLIITTMSLLVPFVTVQISDATYRWLIEYKNDALKIKQAVSSGMFIIIINFILFFIICVSASYIFHVQYTMYFLVLFLFASIFPYLQQIVRGLGNNKLYSIIGIINTFLLVIFNTFFLLVLKYKLEGVLMSTAIANCISILLILFSGKLYKYVSISAINKYELKEMAKYSWPLIPNTISWWLINEVNRFIILFKLGADSNGIFALSNRFPAIILILNSIFMLSWQDHAISNHDNKDKDAFYTKVFNIYMVLELTIVILLISVSRLMVKHLVGPQFYESWMYMPVLYLSVAFSSFAAFLGAGYLGAKKTVGIFATTVCGSVLNLIISYLFISKIGLFAPAIGTLLGFMVMWVVRTYQTRQFFTIKIDYKMFISLLVLCGFFMKLVLIRNAYVEILSIVAAVAIVLIFNKTLFTYLFNSVKKLAVKKQPA